MEGLGLGEYAGAFVEQAVNGACLVELSEADLKDELKVGPLGHRRLLLRELKALVLAGSSSSGGGENGATAGSPGRWVSEVLGECVEEACSSAEGKMEVSNVEVGAKDVAALGRRLRDDPQCSGVREVVLTDVATDGDLAEAFAGVLAGKVREQGGGLRRLGIRECGLDDEGAVALAEALGRKEGAGFALLRGLDLEDNRLTQVACAALAASVSAAPCLTSLNLGYNALGLEGLRVLAQGLSSPGVRLKVLRLDRVGVSEAVPEAVGAALGGLLRDSRSLLDVSFGKNNLRDAGAVALAIKLEEGGGQEVTVQRLRLAYNNVGDEGALALCTAAASTPRLRGLDLSANDVTKRGRQSLREGKLALVHVPAETQGLDDGDDAAEDSDRERDTAHEAPAAEMEGEDEDEGDLDPVLEEDLLEDEDASDSSSSGGFQEDSDSGWDA